MTSPDVIAPLLAVALIVAILALLPAPGPVAMRPHGPSRQAHERSHLHHP
jgi:hypothetical protein